jgi:hypothetical protein
MIVKENGVLYDVDEKTGQVKVNSKSVGEPQADELDFELRDFRTGDRVEVDGEVGTIISITASLYGGAYGVRFDDGGIDEFGENQLKLTEVETPEYDTPISEILGRFASYEKMPHYTNDEINAKEEEARYLNLRAQSLASDSKLVLSEQNKLGKVVLVTGNDLIDLKELREQTKETQEYLSKFNRYKIADEISGYGAGLGLKGDASWLEDALDGMEVVATTDADLAVRAAELVAAFNKVQLEDDEFMQVASSYQKGYLQMDESDAKKFERYLAHARTERLKEFPAENALPDPKEVAAEADLDNFDTAALYL